MSHFYRRLFSIILPTLLPLASPVLSAQVAPPMKISVESLPDTNLAQQWPGIFVRDNALYVTWGEVRPDNTNQSGKLTFSIASWPATPDAGSIIRATFSPDTLTADPEPKTYVFGFGHVEQPQSLNGGVMIPSSHWRDDLVQAEPHDVIHKARFTTYVAKGGSWASAKIFEDRKVTDQVAVGLKGHTFNPDAGEFLSAWTVGTSTSGTVTAVDTAANIVWTVGSIPMEGRTADLLAIGTKDFVVIADTMGRRYRDGLSVGAFKLPHVEGPRYIRLRDSSFLRVYADTGLTRLTVDRYNLSGTLLGSREMLQGHAHPSFFITQDRSNGELALLVGGPGGVYMVRFDETLSGSSEPIRLNTSSDTTNAPAAIYRGDSLYAIWQEYHDGTVDIYGTSYEVRQVDPVGVEEEEAASRGLAIASVTPNPATASAMVDLAVARGSSVAIDLVDQLGRVVLHQLRDRFDGGRVELRLEGVAPGAYMVVARAGGRAVATKLVVTR